MKKELWQLVSDNKDNIQRFIEERNKLRSKVEFCSTHKFEEEVRVSQLKLYHLEGIIYEYQQMIDDLKDILNSNKDVN